MAEVASAPAPAAPPPAARLSPQAAWEPLPAAQFDAAAARHLLRRVTWSARPAEVERAVGEGLSRTLERLFPAEPTSMPQPALIARIAEDAPGFAQRLRAAREADDERARRQIQREERERFQLAATDLALKWLALAGEPAAAAREKWVICLADVYVTAIDKVKNPALLWRHHEIVRQHALGAAPALTKAVSRSPAMVIYLDLQQSGRAQPNENFARELFELFVLGEGHYSEQDIKEAARAFTGYRQVAGEFRFQARQHDRGRKTVFGRSGAFEGDDVIDVAYAQPAAATFLPGELLRYYVADTPLPEAQLEALGAWWRETGFDLRQLLRRVFASQLFFAPEHRGTLIKSPVQFCLGLTADLGLDVAPLQRLTLNPLRFMGQALLRPPNVRGWVGGRAWIHSSALAARRSLVQTLFSPINEDNLNADERIELVAARAEGRATFTVTDERLREFAQADDAAIVSRLVDYFLPIPVSDGFRSTLATALAEAGHDPARRAAFVRRAAITVLQSAEYQLC